MNVELVTNPRLIKELRARQFFNLLSLVNAGLAIATENASFCSFNQLYIASWIGVGISVLTAIAIVVLRFQTRGEPKLYNTFLGKRISSIFALIVQTAATLPLLYLVLLICLGTPWP